jgi:hypothetical protein
LQGFNVFILSFLLLSGPADQALAFTELDADTRASIISDYHSNGISIMVSAFGSTDAPTSEGADPVETANMVAGFVMQYGVSTERCNCESEDLSSYSSMVLMSTTRTLMLSIQELVQLRIGLFLSLNSSGISYLLVVSTVLLMYQSQLD